MFAGFTDRLNFGMGNGGGGTVSVPSAFPVMPIGQLGNYNTYAINFIKAANITDPTQQAAINQLSYDLVSTGLMNKMIAVYPFIGGTADTHKWNLKDPRDADTAFRLTFFGGATHSSTGYLPSISNGYANTFLNPLFVLPIRTLHMSVYSRTSNTTNNNFLDIGQSNGSSVFFQMAAGSNFYLGNGILNQGGFTVTSPNSLGHYIAVRSSDSVRFGFRNGVQNGGPTNFNDTTTYLNLPIFIGGRNNNGTAAQFSGRELAFVTIGQALTQLECATFYTIVQNFQTTLGRNV